MRRMIAILIIDDMPQVFINYSGEDDLIIDSHLDEAKYITFKDIFEIKRRAKKLAKKHISNIKVKIHFI